MASNLQLNNSIQRSHMAYSSAKVQPISSIKLDLKTQEEPLNQHSSSETYKKFSEVLKEKMGQQAKR